MIIVVVIVFIGLIILCWLGRKETIENGVRGRPYCKGAAYLYRRLVKYRRNNKTSAVIGQQLERLDPEIPREEAMKRYYVKKITVCMGVILVGSMLGLIVSIRAGNSARLGENGEIIRGSFRDSAEEVELQGEFADGIQRFRVNVETRRLSENEVLQLYEEFQKKLSGLILGNNTDLMSISDDLNLWESYPDYPFMVDWKSERPDLVSSDGVVNRTDEDSDVTLTAIVRYGEWQWEQQIVVRIVQPAMSEEERIYREREQMLFITEEESRDKESWILPSEWQGNEVKWKLVVRDNGLIIWGASIAVAILIYFFTDKDLHDTVEKRKQAMKRDYPEVVHKLVLYMGAGMTIRGSMQKIADDYSKIPEKNKTDRPIYQEIQFACREIHMGTSEAKAYEHMGKRCGVQECIRLGTLLTQNLKKGNSTLLNRLREEVERANEEHLQYARKKGEEAQTRLLVPMVMMLMVVMLILIIPAFWSVSV